MDDFTPMKVPEKGTMEMVSLLGDIVDSTVDQIPFTFTTGDLMSALMYSMVDAGLRSGTDPAQLRADLVRAIDAVIPDVMAQNLKAKGGLN